MPGALKSIAKSAAGNAPDKAEQTTGCFIPITIFNTI